MQDLEVDPPQASSWGQGDGAISSMCWPGGRGATEETQLHAAFWNFSVEHITTWAVLIYLFGSLLIAKLPSSDCELQEHRGCVLIAVPQDPRTKLPIQNGHGALPEVPERKWMAAYVTSTTTRLGDSYRHTHSCHHFKKTNKLSFFKRSLQKNYWKVERVPKYPFYPLPQPPLLFFLFWIRVAYLLQLMNQYPYSFINSHP